jgi:NADPH2:quinone reductase
VQAVIVREYGSTPVAAEVPMPQPKAGQLLIRLRAAGVNPMDRVLASGDWRPMPAIFPMVLGADGAGVVEKVGEGTTRFTVGEKVFGQFLVAPLGSAGTYAEYVAVTEDAPLAHIPHGLEFVVASALPTAGMTGLSLVEGVLGPLTRKTLLIVGAGGGVGTFATQFAVNAGARVIANVHESAAVRFRGYGAAEIVDHTANPVADQVLHAHPGGIDALLDLVSDAGAFEKLARLVRPGGTAVTTKYVADTAALEAEGIIGVNFALSPSGEILDRLADALVMGRIQGPPITRISLDDAPGVLGGVDRPPVDGKFVIVLPE